MIDGATAVCFDSEKIQASACILVLQSKDAAGNDAGPRFVRFDIGQTSMTVSVLGSADHNQKATIHQSPVPTPLIGLDDLWNALYPKGFDFTAQQRRAVAACINAVNGKFDFSGV